MTKVLSMQCFFEYLTRSVKTLFHFDVTYIRRDGRKNSELKTD